VDAEDVHQLSASILEVLSNSELRDTLVRKGAAQILKFPWRDTALKTLATYHKAWAEHEQNPRRFLDHNIRAAVVSLIEPSSSKFVHETVNRTLGQ
jgi:uncharacterized membrane-anchored protein YjiN (DUF445 family)